MGVSCDDASGLALAQMGGRVAVEYPRSVAVANFLEIDPAMSSA